MLDLSPQLQSKAFDSIYLHLNGWAGSSPSRRSAWEKLNADLRGLGLNKASADVLVSWAGSQAEQNRREPLRIRVLHPMEKEFVSPEAYGYLLDLQRLGLIHPMQMEQLLEGCAFLTSLPAGREQMQRMALKVFLENLVVQGLGTSH